MSLRRLFSVSSVVVVATGAALAQPKKDDKAPAPAAPAGSAAPAAEGSAVAPIEDTPPSDIEGRDENPDAPRGTQVQTTVTTAPVEAKPAGYPIEMVQRPITLPANLAEVAIGPHFRASPYAGSDALRARYGITPKIQLGLTYVMGGIFNDPLTTEKDYGFHPGKAGGLDVTVLVTNWLAIKGGVPVYFDPFAMSIALGAPMKFRLGDKLAVGGMEDVLNIAFPKDAGFAGFAPDYYQEEKNAIGAARDENMTVQSDGFLRFSGYAQYQHKPNLAIVGRFALELEDFATTKTAACSDECAITSLHGGVMFTPKKFLDVGGTLGFDDLSSMPDSFALSGFLAFRI